MSLKIEVGSIVRHENKLKIVTGIQDGKNGKVKYTFATNITVAEDAYSFASTQLLTSGANVEMAETRRLNDRQRFIISYAILTVTRTSHISSFTTYQTIQEALEGNTRYCRGVGQSCAAIYRSGITEVHDLIRDRKGRRA